MTWQRSRTYDPKTMVIPYTTFIWKTDTKTVDKDTDNTNDLTRTYSDTDPELIQIIKKRYLISPASSDTKYNEV